MKLYLVGGAVRDALLERPVTERDWLVEGATVTEMLGRGYKRVGHHFPVFLHPDTGEEYALARTEKKAGSGHKGFAFEFSPDTTAIEDLRRRDFTINAMACDTKTGVRLDPYGGVADIEARLLRHVSTSFAEDPLRVLRGARFLAQLAPWQFQLAPETAQLMTDMSRSGELRSLPAERVWRECVLALQAADPARFFQTLADVHALTTWFAPLQTEFAVRMARLGAASHIHKATEWRWAALFFPHEREQASALSRRLRTPHKTRTSAELLCQYEDIVLRRRGQPVTAADAHRQAENIMACLRACRAHHSTDTLYALLDLAYAVSSLHPPPTMPSLLRAQWHALHRAATSVPPPSDRTVAAQFRQAQEQAVAQALLVGQERAAD